RNNCPKCFAQDGLVFSFFNKVVENKLMSKATNEIKGELTCSHCETVIYPALWTDEIDRVYLYNLKRIGNPEVYTRFKPLAVGIFVGVTIAIAGAAFAFYKLQQP
ncbi:MAG: hypothetical protein NWQ06_07510, partial [Leeuwenhoekiella sp.]|nr:hypothetical protein [Leeuwenhoekiella sp.]